MAISTNIDSQHSFQSIFIIIRIFFCILTQITSSLNSHHNYHGFQLYVQKGVPAPTTAPISNSTTSQPTNTFFRGNEPIAIYLGSFHDELNEHAAKLTKFLFV